MMAMAKRLQIGPLISKIGPVDHRHDVIHHVAEDDAEAILFAEPAERVLPPESRRKPVPSRIIAALPR